MFKKSLFIMLFIITNMQAWAGDHIIRYEDFVHFQYEQKIETIKLIHTYLTELEQLSIDERAKLKKTSKYQSFQKIWNFFLSSSYASDEIKNFTDLTTKTSNNAGQEFKDDLCYYAGWISHLNPQGRCYHPRDLEKNISKLPQKRQLFLKNIVKKYQENSSAVHKLVYKDGRYQLLAQSASCEGTNEVLCNPTLYGKHQAKAFCVSGNAQFGLNSSFLCSKAGEALKDKKQKDDLMRSIAENAIGDDSDEFFYGLRTMYDSCLCAGGAQQDEKYGNSISFQYAQRIFYTRTCYGIIAQTQNIYESLKANSQTVCAESSKIYRTVNHPTELGYIWNKFLTKVNKHIETQKEDEDLKTYLKNLKYLSQGSPSLKQKDAAEEKDKKAFEAQRKKDFSYYVKNKFCPIGVEGTLEPDPDQGLYQLTTKLLDATENSIERFIEATISPVDGVMKPKDIKMSANIVDGKDLTPAQDAKNPLIFLIPVNQTMKDFSVNIDATVDGEDLTASEDIPALNGPKLEIELVDHSDEKKEKTYKIAILKIVAPEAVATDKEASKADYSDATISLLPKDIGAELDNTDEDKTETRFEIKRQAEDIDVYGTAPITYLGAEFVLESSKVTVPLIGDDEDTTGSCSVTLTLAENKKTGPKLDMKLEYAGKSYPDGEDLYPSDVDYAVAWYDSMEVSEEKEAAPTQTKNTLSSLKTGAEKKEEDEKKREPAEEKDELTTKIEEELNLFSENTSRVDFPLFGEMPMDRTIGVVVTLSKKGKRICQTSAEHTIAGTGGDSSQLNNNPVRKNTPPARVRSNGGFHGGLN